jgi:hypothetical protein
MGLMGLIGQIGVMRRVYMFYMSKGADALAQCNIEYTV